MPGRSRAEELLQNETKPSRASRNKSVCHEERAAMIALAGYSEWFGVKPLPEFMSEFFQARNLSQVEIDRFLCAA